MAATNDTKFLSYTQYENTLSRLAATTGGSLSAGTDNSFQVRLMAVNGESSIGSSWTHPTATARTLSTANQVIKTLTVDAYGHVTAATQGALVAADIPNLNASKITAGTLGVARGGTGKSSWTQYGIVYASATDTLSQIALPTWTASTTYWLKCVTDSSKVPTYSLSTIGKADVGLGNVENTALSTWAGSTNITKLGTVTTGTWSATTIATTKGGTGLTSYTKGNILYASDTNVLAKLAANDTTTKKWLSMTSSVPSWVTLSGTDITSGTINFARLPSMYIGRTSVASSAANVTLLGVDGFTNTSSASTSDDKSLVVWDATNNAWHFSGNVYADGWLSALGVGSGSGGGGVDGIDILRSWSDYSSDDTTQVLGSNLGYNMNTRITALENSSTSVSFTQTITSGKEIGTLTIDGATTKLYAPSSYALSEITSADDLKAIEAITGTSGVLQKTAANTWSLVSKTDSTSASAISTGTGLVTERDVYYGLPKINNAHNYTSSSAYYAPTSGGTAGYLLKAVGSTSAPTWDSVSNIMSAYATTSAMNQAISDAIGGVTQFDYQVVTTLPTTGTKGTIYLVAHTHGTNDVYDEYIWVTNSGSSKYEKIGNTDIDLSGYWQTADLVAITATENTTLLNTYFPVS